MTLGNKIGRMLVMLMAVGLAWTISNYGVNSLAQESQAAGTYGEFEGVVTNYATGNPVYMAKVRFYDSTGQLKVTVYTNSAGYYITKVWNGIYRIEVSKIGWETKNKTAYTCCIASEDPTRVDFRLRKIQ